MVITSGSCNANKIHFTLNGTSYLREGRVTQRPHYLGAIRLYNQWFNHFKKVIKPRLTSLVQCGQVLGNWIRNVNGKLVGGYPQSAEDIETEREMVFKFINRLFSRQQYLTTEELKKLFLLSWVYLNMGR